MSLLKNYLGQESYHEIAKGQETVPDDAPPAPVEAPADVEEPTKVEVEVEVTTDSGEVEIEIEIEIPEVQDVSDSEVYEADIIIDEAPQIANEMHKMHEEGHEIEADLRQHIASLEHHIEILQFGIEQRQFSPQYAAAVSHSLEQYQDLLGGTIETPALESYDSTNLEEYYVASLEAFSNIKETLTKLLLALKTKIQRQLQVIGRARKVGEAITKKADAGLTKLKAVDGTGEVEVALAGIPGRFNLKGVFQEDLNAAVVKDQAALKTFAEAYDAAVKTFSEKLSKFVSNNIFAITTDNAEKALSELADLKLPIAGFAEKDTVFLGAQLKFKGTDTFTAHDVRRSITKIAGQNSAHVLVDKTKTTGQVPSKLTLSKASVTQLHQNAKRYVAVAEQLKKLADNALTLTVKLDDMVSVEYEDKDGNTQTSGSGFSPHSLFGELITIASDVVFSQCVVMQALQNEAQSKAVALNQLAERATGELSKTK